MSNARNSPFDAAAPGLRRRPSTGERGWSLFGVVLLVGVVAVVLSEMVVASTYGVLAARRSRDDLTVRLAAVEVLNRPAPDEDGGSTAPDSPLVGWSDVVAVDPTTGRMVDTRQRGVGMPRIRRQWRASTDIPGHRRLAVSATIVDLQDVPVSGGDGLTVTLERSLRP